MDCSPSTSSSNSGPSNEQKEEIKAIKRPQNQNCLKCSFHNETIEDCVGHLCKFQNCHCLNCTNLAFSMMMNTNEEAPRKRQKTEGLDERSSSNITSFEPQTLMAMYRQMCLANSTPITLPSSQFTEPIQSIMPNIPEFSISNLISSANQQSEIKNPQMEFSITKFLSDTSPKFPQNLMSVKEDSSIMNSSNFHTSNTNLSHMSSLLSQLSPNLISSQSQFNPFQQTPLLTSSNQISIGSTHQQQQLPDLSHSLMSQLTETMSQFGSQSNCSKNVLLNFDPNSGINQNVSPMNLGFVPRKLSLSPTQNSSITPATSPNVPLLVNKSLSNQSTIGFKELFTNQIQSTVNEGMARLALGSIMVLELARKAAGLHQASKLSQKYFPQTNLTQIPSHMYPLIQKDVLNITSPLFPQMVMSTIELNEKIPDPLSVFHNQQIHLQNNGLSPIHEQASSKLTQKDPKVEIQRHLLQQSLHTFEKQLKDFIDKNLLDKFENGEMLLKKCAHKLPLKKTKTAKKKTLKQQKPSTSKAKYQQELSSNEHKKSINESWAFKNSTTPTSILLSSNNNELPMEIDNLTSKFGHNFWSPENEQSNSQKTSNWHPFHDQQSTSKLLPIQEVSTSSLPHHLDSLNFQPAILFPTHQTKQERATKECNKLDSNFNAEPSCSNEMPYNNLLHSPNQLQYPSSNLHYAGPKSAFKLANSELASKPINDSENPRPGSSDSITIIQHIRHETDSKGFRNPEVNEDQPNETIVQVDELPSFEQQNSSNCDPNFNMMPPELLTALKQFFLNANADPPLVVTETMNPMLHAHNFHSNTRESTNSLNPSMHIPIPHLPQETDDLMRRIAELSTISNSPSSFEKYQNFDESPDRN